MPIGRYQFRGHGIARLKKTEPIFFFLNFFNQLLDHQSAPAV
jgi:hypothetical protein